MRLFTGWPHRRRTPPPENDSFFIASLSPMELPSDASVRRAPPRPTERRPPDYASKFDNTPMQSVAKGAVDLGKLQDEAEKKAAEEAAEAFKPVLARLKEALKDKAQDVRITTRLVDSPACLVVTDSGMSMQLARMLKQAGQKIPEVKPVLEVNAEHPLVKKLEGSEHFDDLAHILFDQALLAEGGLPDDPAAYVKRVNALLA
jgi:molecular chaperone HtpG